MVPAFGWETFEEARFVEHELNQGDTFIVEIERDGRPERHLVNLYFVDAPEISAENPANRRRALEQVRYFGLTQPEEVTSFGFDAVEFVRRELTEPFQLHTVFASAPDRETEPRIYALVTTARGDDLGTLLVEKGFARAHGVGRALPDGTASADHAARLETLEKEAREERRGIWSASLQAP